MEMKETKIQEPPTLTVNRNDTLPVEQDQITYYLPNPNQAPVLPMTRQNLELTNDNLQDIIAVQNVNVNIQENVNPPERWGCLDACQCKQLMIACLVLNFLLIISLGGCVIYLLEKQVSLPKQLQENTFQSNNNTDNKDEGKKSFFTSKQFICSIYPDYCKDIPLAVSDYIFQNYYEANTIKALLQVSRSLNFSSPFPSSYWYESEFARYRLALVTAHRNITQSVQCLSYFLPNNFSEVFQDIINRQFVTKYKIQSYYNMTELSGGQPYKISPPSDVTKFCKFNFIPQNQSYRRLQNSTSNCGQNQTQIILFINGLGYGPNTIIQNLKKIQDALMSNPNTSSFENIISMGVWKKQLYLGYFNNFTTSFQQFLSQIGSPVPSKASIYQAFQMVINMQKTNSSLPSDFTSQIYEHMVKFYIRKIAQSLVSNSTIYDFYRPKEFITQQLNEGKKVIIVGHGEGTIFANKLYDSLDTVQRQSVAAVYLAPASKFMPDGQANYITNPNDQIIEYLRGYAGSNQSFPIPLSSNMDAENFSSQKMLNTNHYMIGYLQTYKDKFIEMVNGAKNRVFMPNKMFGAGQITVNLVWVAYETDLDLMICSQSEWICVQNNSRQSSFGKIETNTYYKNTKHFVSTCDIGYGKYNIHVGRISGTSLGNLTLTISSGNEIHIANRTFIAAVNQDPSSNGFIGYRGHLDINYNQNTRLKMFSLTYYPQYDY